MEILIANFKMNKTNTEIEQYLKEFNENLSETCDKKIYLCLPFTALYLAKDFQNEKFFFGAQNMHEEENGSYTGEISAKMLAELGVKIVLIGHSERRKYFNENNEKINKKIKTALRYGFQIVLCVGETRTQRNMAKTKEVLKKQIEEALVGIYENELKSIIIAYEPVWAIGTGTPADTTDISRAADIIREIICEHYSKGASIDQKVIYGGSLTSQNSKQIFKNPNIVGALVSGASLNATEFAKLCK